jgi:SAM-dependent methyltransferase
VDGTTGEEYRKRDFWDRENLKFSKPHFRMRKVAGQVRKVAGGREVSLLDVGCGPAALAGLLPPNVLYHGIDIAIQEPAPNLVEADLIDQPVAFGDLRFDIVVAQGVFEYMGGVQSRKLAEIAGLLRGGGTFICTYQNFAHRRRHIYGPYSNVRQPEDFRRDLGRFFAIEQAFPTAYNWNPSHPRRPWLRAPQERVSVNVPFIGRKLAVDYYYRCTPRSRVPAAA